MKVDIQYSLLKNPLKKGIILYGCKMCPITKYFNDFKSMFEHYENHHDMFPLVSICRKCKKDRVHQDLTENDFVEHSCQEIKEVGNQSTIENVENSNYSESEQIFNEKEQISDASGEVSNPLQTEWSSSSHVFTNSETTNLQKKFTKFSLFLFSTT